MRPDTRNSWHISYQLDQRPWELRTKLSIPLGVGARIANDIYQVAYAEEDTCGVCPKELLSAVHDRVEHGLLVGLRAADDAQDFARRRLLLQGSPALRTRCLEPVLLLL